MNLRAVGATTAITGWTSEGTVTVNPVATAKTPAGLEAIDMGNGLKWANMNVGAEIETDYGDYFAWGETMPYYQEGYSRESPCTHWIDGKSGYNWANYSLCNGTASTMIKYCINGEDGSYGYVDNKTELERTHDAASANWGAGWRMPTDAEWTWLRENCTWKWTEDYLGKDVQGMIVTSNLNGNIIFLPAAKLRSNDVISTLVAAGYYWSSSLYEYSYVARSVFFKSGDYVARNSDSRYYGQSVRPVTE